MPNYVAGEGPFNPRLMIVGEAPGKAEDEQRRPFVGPTGELLNDMLFKAGINRNECYVTNVVKYQPPWNDFKKLHLIDVDLEASIKYLWDNEINKFHPNCILAVGDRALNALTGLSGILNYRGSILRGLNGTQKVVATIHPAALFDKGSATGLPWVYKKLIEHDISRAGEQSLFPDFRLPDRTLSIARNSLDVYRFFQEYKLLFKAANDIESINCIPVCTGFAFNKYHALSIPLLTKVGANPITDMSRAEIIQCWKFIQEAFERLYLIGHNFKYDEYKQNLFGFKNLKLHSDTLLKVHTIFPELPIKKLYVCSSLWTEEPFYKDEGTEQKVGKKFDVERFFKYNAKDCAVEFEVDEAMDENLDTLSSTYKVPMREFYYNYVMKKHAFYLKLENNGFKVDETKKAELKSRYEMLREVSHESVERMVGHSVNVKSGPQMFELLYKEMNFPLPKSYKTKIIKKTGEEVTAYDGATSEDAIIGHIGNHCKGKDGAFKIKILTEILEERRIRDQISRAIDFKADYDGRCKTSIKITGTETARTSTNTLKKPVRPKVIGLAFHTIPKHGRLARDIRSMFIPDEGFVFIQGDLSQAEARIVAVLSEDWALLKAFDEIDIHRRTAGLFFGFTSSLILTPGFIPHVDDMDKDGAERYSGKTFRHAGNYDMRKHTAMVNYNTNAQKYEINTSISEWKAGQFIDLFHAASPKIRKVFHKSIADCIASNRTLINPFGRVRQFFGRFDSEVFGEACAQIPQSTVADIKDTGAMEAWDEWGHDSRIAIFVSESHDSLVAQVPTREWELYARSLKSHMLRPVSFNTYCSLNRAFDLTIPVDIEVSISSNGLVTSYGELTKASKISPSWEGVRVA